MAAIRGKFMRRATWARAWNGSASRNVFAPFTSKRLTNGIAPAQASARRFRAACPRRPTAFRRGGSPGANRADARARARCFARAADDADPAALAEMAHRDWDEVYCGGSVCARGMVRRDGRALSAHA